MILKVVKLNSEAVTPTRNYHDDAGLDLHALHDTFIPLGKTVLVKTGIAINIPIGHVGKIEDRSSMALKGIRTGAGVIDPGYTGEIGVVLHNLNNQQDHNIGRLGFTVKVGDKIAQLLLLETRTFELVVQDTLDTTPRSNSGFGSSGR